MQLEPAVSSFHYKPALTEAAILLRLYCPRLCQISIDVLIRGADKSRYASPNP